MTDEKAEQMQSVVRTLTGKDLSVQDAREQVRDISTTESKREKDRIAAEIRQLLGTE